MLCVLLASLLASALRFASPSVPQTRPAPSFESGTIISSIVAADNQQQTYALYLPSYYTANRSWPIIYVFDPLARGELALRQFQHAAELHGFIIAASNNSRNGLWKPQAQAAEAMLTDTQQRFSIDTKRIYFAGFSGGARVSSQLALLCKCAAGVLLSGAGFPRNAPPSLPSKFAVFSAVGDADFNYAEVIPLQNVLDKAGQPHWLRVFQGPHDWAPPPVMDEALAFFRLQAMKSGLEPGDQLFTSSQLDVAVARATADQNPLSAWREFRQIVSTYDSLADVNPYRSKAASLEKDKSVRDLLKREREAFDEQDRLNGEIFAAIPSQSDSDNDERVTPSALQLTRDLRQRSATEKRPDRALILKRSLGGIFIGAIESGSDALDKKNFALAAKYFACAAEANPESEWVFRQLAVARSLSGDRKGAIDALRSARRLAVDPAAFSKWVSEQPSLARLKPE